MTTVVPQAPLISRRQSSKPLAKAPTINGANQTRASPDYTITTPTDKLIYPFSITHLASNGDTYTLYTESAQGRSTWVDKILEAKIERAALNAKIEPFQARIIAESVFGNPTTFEQLTQKPPALVALSTMHRALTSLREGPIGSRTLGRAITHARVNCAKSFIAPENTDYAHQRLVAVGTEDGVYIGHMPEASGLCTTWTKVLSLPQTTQIDVMDEFGVFLVLANKELIAYSLSSIVPQLPLERGSVAYSLPQRQPQRLSGSHSVGFFATGKLKDRMLVIYKKKSGVTSIFKAMEPVVGKADLNRRNLFSRKKTQTEFFRDYDVYTY
jgi:CNH domain